VIQDIYANLIHEFNQRSGLLSTLRKPKLVKGAYLWGGVGIGKTFLLDCLFHCLPFPNKLRMHFHQFMQLIHHELKINQGLKDQLKKIAKKFANKNVLICLDEFIVSDIVDAMLLSRLLTILFSCGVCLVTTSNTTPDDLYKNGLQRKSFLSAIKLLKHNTNVIHLPTIIDYRIQYLKSAGVFYTPHDKAANNKMEKCFAVLCDGEEECSQPIEIGGRFIHIIKQAGECIWFDFATICSVPRSQQDYLMIAKHYKNVFISNIPYIPANANNVINLFIRMIDVFYDSHIRLIFSATVSIDEIYTQGYMMPDFQRTRSRLLEMQSEKYFSVISSELLC
jgi:cell division protein ZapE